MDSISDIFSDSGIRGSISSGVIVVPTSDNIRHRLYQIEPRWCRTAHCIGGILKYWYKLGEEVWDLRSTTAPKDVLLLTHAALMREKDRISLGWCFRTQPWGQHFVRTKLVFIQGHTMESCSEVDAYPFNHLISNDLFQLWANGLSLSTKTNDGRKREQAMWGDVSWCNAVWERTGPHLTCSTWPSAAPGPRWARNQFSRGPCNSLERNVTPIRPFSAHTFAFSKS